MSQALLGLPAIIFLAWLTSSARRQFPLKLVVAGVLAQLLLAALLLKVPLLQEALLEDGELHSDQSRQRRFRWQGIGKDQCTIFVFIFFFGKD